MTRGWWTAAALQYVVLAVLIRLALRSGPWWVVAVAVLMAVLLVYDDCRVIRQHREDAPPPQPVTTVPVPMLMACPDGHQHVDSGEWAQRLHRTHQCQEPGCGKEWRPADVPTVGVLALPSGRTA